MTVATTAAPVPNEAALAELASDAARAGSVAAELKAAFRYLRDRNPVAVREIVDRLLLRQAGNASVLGLAGALAMQEGMYHKAADFFGRAADRRSDLPETWHNLASALEEAGERNQAEAAYGKALAVKPDYLPSLQQLAVLLRVEGRFEEALSLHARAVALEPRNPQVHAWLAATRQLMGDAQGAIRDYRRALRFAPADMESRMSLATALLGLGRFEEGWAQYEWRLPHFMDPDPALNKRWLPWEGEALGNQRLVVVAEQGLGDNIQFARYLALLRQREPLAGLLTGAPSRCCGSWPGSQPAGTSSWFPGGTAISRRSRSKRTFTPGC